MMNNIKTDNYNFSNILLIGPRYNRKNPDKIGGIVVLFEELIKQFEERDISYWIVDSNKENYSNKIVALISIYLQFLYYIMRSSHVSLHGTANDYLFFAPFFTFISNLFNKHISLRKFAGNYNLYYENYNFFIKLLIKYSLKNSNALFFETKSLVKYFKNFNKNTYWFPNVRDIKQKKYTPRSFSKKFVFISSVKQTKGINEIVNSFQELPKEYSIDIYGPIEDKEINIEDLNLKNIKYMGVLNSLDVIETLKDYDFLVLPTYHKGEGYPGIIIEALALGIPTISTYWNAIPELIIDNYNGLLIEPKNYLELKNKILDITDTQYQVLSYNAFKSFYMFDSTIQTNSFLKTLND